MKKHRIAIIYASVHHGNTKKLLKEASDGTEFEIKLIEAKNAIRKNPEDWFEGCDAIGFASGVYMGKLHSSLYTFLDAYCKKLKENSENADTLKNSAKEGSFAQERAKFLPRRAFIIFTSGSGMRSGASDFKRKLEENGFDVLGVCSCRGYDTYGPFKLVGGIAKGRPDGRDIKKAREFILNLPE